MKLLPSPRLTLLCISAALFFVSQPFAHAIDYGYEVLYRFHGSDGSNPNGSVTFDSQGDLLGTTRYGGLNYTGSGYGNGTVFRLSASSGFTEENFIYKFGSQPDDGINPVGTLILDNLGVLFGVTRNGGDPSVGTPEGTAFKLIPDSSSPPNYAPTTLYTFGATGDAASPAYSLLMGGDGNLYGSSRNGGANSDGAVFKLDAPSYTSGSVLFSFDIATSGAQPLCALTLDGNGDMWGTAESGGDNSLGTVFRLTKGSTFATPDPLKSFEGQPNDGANPQAGLIFDADSGNLYGTTYDGGNNDNGTVYKITDDGTKTVLYNFGDPDHPNDGRNPFASLVFDDAGDLLGTTISGGTNNQGTVFSFTKASGYTQKGYVYNFGDPDHPNDGANPVAELTADPSGSGKFYGTTFNGGSAAGNDGNGIVFVLIPTPTSSPIPSPTTSPSPTPPTPAQASVVSVVAKGRHFIISRTGALPEDVVFYKIRTRALGDTSVSGLSTTHNAQTRFVAGQTTAVIRLKKLKALVASTPNLGVKVVLRLLPPPGSSAQVSSKSKAQKAYDINSAEARASLILLPTILPFPTSCSPFLF